MNAFSRVAGSLVLMLSLILPLAAAATENGGGDAGDADTDGAPKTPAIASLPQYIADLTQRGVEQLVAQIASIADALGNAEGTSRPIDWDRVGAITAELAIVVMATRAVLRPAAPVAHGCQPDRRVE